MGTEILRCRLPDLSAGVEPEWAESKRACHAMETLGRQGRRGHVDAAFRWLDRGYAERGSFMTAVNAEPAFERLHADPRWELLLGRMGLAPSAVEEHAGPTHGPTSADPAARENSDIARRPARARPT